MAKIIERVKAAARPKAQSAIDALRAEVKLKLEEVDAKVQTLENKVASLEASSGGGTDSVQ